VSRRRSPAARSTDRQSGLVTPPMAPREGMATVPLRYVDVSW
jgi:hypothetical protein